MKSKIENSAKSVEFFRKSYSSQILLFITNITQELTEIFLNCGYLLIAKEKKSKNKPFKVTFSVQ